MMDMLEPRTHCKQTQRVVTQLNMRIPMHDGIHLSGNLYLPDSSAFPAPAILTVTPYVKQVHHEQGVYFSKRGFAYLAVDSRGRGESQGVYRADAREGLDVAEVIEWLCRQHFCNGKVSMWGGSYSGYLQWAAAKCFPECLVSIAPAASPFRGLDGPMRNNIFSTYRMQWLTYLSGKTAQDRIFADQAFWRDQFRCWLESGTPFSELDQFVGNPSEIFQNWMEHPHHSDHWDQFNLTVEEYGRLDLPILSITGACDANQAGTIAHYRAHMRWGNDYAKQRHYLVIGPWDHAGTRIPKRRFAGIEVGAESLIDLPKLHADWYDWTMRDGAKPAFLHQNICYYVMSADTWRYADTLEEITESVETLYLHSHKNPTDVFHAGALLPDGPKNSGPDVYIYDPRDLTHLPLQSKIDPEDRSDQTMIHAFGKRQLVYHGAPYAEATDISGFFKLSLWISIDKPDTDFTVSIYEINRHGKSFLLSNDILRARYRNGLRQPHVVPDDTPQYYEFALFPFVSRLIGRGSRLRLTIGPIDSLHFEKNYNSEKPVAFQTINDAGRVTVKIFHDCAHLAALHVPLGRATHGHRGQGCEGR